MDNRSPILVAEDHEINQLLMSASLASQGYEAVVVGDGAAAVAAVMEAEEAGRAFALVFMDLQMPVVDGYGAARAIRERGIAADRLPIIALTASPVEDVADACAAAGMQAALTKPLPMHELGGLVSEWTVAGPAPVAGPALPMALDRLRRELSAVAGHELDFRERARRVEQALQDWLGAAGATDRSPFALLARRVAYELPAATQSEQVEALTCDVLEALKAA